MQNSNHLENPGKLRTNALLDHDEYKGLNTHGDRQQATGEKRDNNKAGMCKSRQDTGVIWIFKIYWETKFNKLKWTLQTRETQNTDNNTSNTKIKITRTSKLEYKEEAIQECTKDGQMFPKLLPA